MEHGIFFIVRKKRSDPRYLVNLIQHMLHGNNRGCPAFFSANDKLNFLISSADYDQTSSSDGFFAGKTFNFVMDDVTIL
jgi:hypothetical protein